MKRKSKAAVPCGSRRDTVKTSLYKNYRKDHKTATKTWGDGHSSDQITVNLL